MIAEIIKRWTALKKILKRKVKTITTPIIIPSINGKPNNNVKNTYNTPFNNTYKAATKPYYSNVFTTF